MRRLLATAVARVGLGDRLRRANPERAIVARAFDRAFYLKSNTDVAEAGADPLEHFLTFGWQEGRDPTPDFSVENYLAAFPEVRDAGVNPFLHYLTSGRPRALPPESPQGFRYEVIERLIPVEDRIAASRAAVIAPAEDDALVDALAASRGDLSRLHVSFSHDDYTANLGGLQLAIQREAQRLAKLGRDHLHLFPATAWQTVRTPDDPGGLGVVWNGREVGTFTAAAVARVLSAAPTAPPGARSFAIHSLLGHEPDEVADILSAVGLRAGVFWLHDFASLCAGFHLLRNDVADCGAPPLDSAACSICLYGPWRRRHVEAHARLFQRLSLTVAAPSQVTLDLWTRTADLPTAGTTVLPHATLTELAPAPPPRPGRPFRVAYAGLPTPHKGWPIFSALAVEFADDERYEFIHLGARKDPRLPIHFQAVSAGADRPQAMQEALAAAAPDAVLVWPLCRETFSFVAYEAVAAGCAVVTGPDSGNVAAFVEAGHGRVLPDEAALKDAFRSGAILELGRAQRRPMLYELRFSALTLDLAAAPTS